MNETRQRYLRMISHHATWFLGTRFPNAIPLVFVVGYPKSGTTWATALVADVLQMPWPKLSLMPIGCEAVVHGHERVWESYPNGIYVLRDGRDVLVSKYFYLSAPIPEGDHPSMTARQRRNFPGLVNKVNVRENLAAFVERQMCQPVSSLVNWGKHVRSYFEVKNPNIVLWRYEDQLRDGEATLACTIRQLTGQNPDPQRVRDTVRKFSFRRQAGREPGQEDRSSFLRKGQAGDWVNYFSREAAEIFDRYCGDMLIAAGYEHDHSWVQSCGASNDGIPGAAARKKTERVRR